MGSRGKGNTGGSKPVKQDTDGYENMTVDSIKRGLLSYAKQDRWNRNTEYSLGFNDSAQITIDDVANANLGFASDVAKTVQKYGYRISERQAYTIARAAYENKIGLNSRNAHIIYEDTSKQRAAQAKIESQQRAERRAEYNSKYKRSSTKVEVGAKVTDSKGKTGTISSIITRSSGYVEVRYDDGTSGKQMAFNLMGGDGNPLKKRPN